MGKKYNLPQKQFTVITREILNHADDELSNYYHRFILNLNEGVRSVNVCQDRYLLISFEGWNGIIKVFDMETLKYLPNDYSGHMDSVRLTSISSNNKYFWTASWDGTFRLFNLHTGECEKSYSALGRSPSCFLDPEGKYLFTATYDSDFDLDARNNGRCWDLSTGKVVSIYRHVNERKKVECMDIAFDQKFVYTGSDDGCLYRFNLSGGQPQLEYFNFDGSIRKIAVSENLIAAACTDGFIRIHNKHSGIIHKYLFHTASDIRDVKISKDESRIYSASEDGYVKGFDLNSGEEVFDLQAHSYWIWSIALYNNDKVLVTGAGDCTITFISTKTGKIIARLINLLKGDNILIISPRDEAFPNGGCFYTTNTDFIKVYSGDEDTGKAELLDLKDPKRLQYIESRNLKNLIISKLRNNGTYNHITSHYLNNKKILRENIDNTLPLMLK